jgi:hypothetical protein
MIVSRDINPERDVYYLGARVIETISNSKKKEFDFFDIFEKLKVSNNISVNLFILTLDWLYLIEAINSPVNGKITKCF